MALTEVQPNSRQPLIPPSQALLARESEHSPGLCIGSTIVLSGQVGLDSEGVPIEDDEAQIVAAFEGVREVLALADASMQDIVDLQTFHVDFDHFETFSEVKKRFLMGPVFPAWTAVQVAALAIPGLIVEIKVSAIRPQ